MPFVRYWLERRCMMPLFGLWFGVLVFLLCRCRLLRGCSVARRPVSFRDGILGVFMRGTPKVTYRRITAHFRRPYMLVATLFLISAIFWLGISFGHIVTQSHSHILATGRQTTINEATLLRNYTVNYPIFHDQKLDSIIKQYVSNQIDTFENKLVNHSDTRNYLDISYTFLQAGTRSATIEFNTRVVYAGKPDVFNRHYMTLDLVEKREITSKDILKQNPEARTLLARLLHDYFKHQPSVQLSSVDLVEILEMSMANLSDVYLRADTMVLSFNPY